MTEKNFRDLSAFFGSTAATILAQGQRVRNVIGDAHWQSDGFYKERLIKKAINEVIPSTFKVGSGFLIYAKDRNKQEYEISNQLDVIVYDDRYITPIFQDDGFVIVMAETAVSVIEVTSSWKNLEKLVEDIKKLQLAHSLYKKAKGRNEPVLFKACVAFSSNRDKKTRSNKRKVPRKLIRIVQRTFLQGLEDYYNIISPITKNDLVRFETNFVRELIPEFILCIDDDWALTPFGNSTLIAQRPHYCPALNEKSMPSTDCAGLPVNHSFHLLLATLRHRCIEWLTYGRRASIEFQKTKQNLSNLIFERSYETIGKPICLLPPESGLCDLFPDCEHL